MSAAFDTINRHHLLDIVKSIVNEDEHRLLQFLLSGTVIDTRKNDTSTSKLFTSNVGTPQGDSLSPALFTIYLEHALKEVRPTLPRPTTSFEEEIPNEVAYVDDVDFIGQNYADINKIQEVLKNISLKSIRTRQSTHQYQKAKNDGKKQKK